MSFEGDEMEDVEGWLMPKSSCQEKLVSKTGAQSWRPLENMKPVYPLNSARQLGDVYPNFRLSASDSTDDTKLWECRGLYTGIRALAVCNTTLPHAQFGSGFFATPRFKVTNDVIDTYHLNADLWEGKYAVGFITAWHVLEGRNPLKWRLASELVIDQLTAADCFLDTYHLLFSPRDFSQFAGVVTEMASPEAKNPPTSSGLPRLSCIQEPSKKAALGTVDIAMGLALCREASGGCVPFAGNGIKDFFCVPSSAPPEGGQGELVSAVGYPASVSPSTARQYLDGDAAANPERLAEVQLKMEDEYVRPSTLSVSVGDVVGHSSTVIKHRASTVAGMSGSRIGPVDKPAVAHGVHIQRRDLPLSSAAESNFNYAVSMHADICVLGYVKHMLPLLCHDDIKWHDPTMIGELLGFVQRHRSLLDRNHLLAIADEFVLKYGGI